FGCGPSEGHWRGGHDRDNPRDRQRSRSCGRQALLRVTNYSGKDPGRPSMSIATRPLSLTINGDKIGPMDVPEELMMVDFLAEHLGLTARVGCGQGICRACTVIVDYPDGHSEEIQTCITAAHDLAGKSLRTIEGHAERDALGNVVRL